MRKSLLVAILLALCAGLLFGTAIGDTEAAAGTATSAGEIPDSWYAPKNASQLGITSFNEAPMLAAMVAAGELPAVAERLPNDPLVVEPYDSVGTYGGTLTTGVTSIYAWGGHIQSKSTYMFDMDPGVTKLVPNVAQAYTLSDDAEVLTLALRPGMKWSDGEDFTVNDIIFWYEDLAKNPDYFWGAGFWQRSGEYSEFTKINDYTLQIEFPAPFRQVLGYLNYYLSGELFFYMPKHYVSQFHIDYNDEADEKAVELGYEKWQDALFNETQVFPQQKDVNMPVLTPWRLESASDTQTSWVRNAYYHAVDTAGNQLPYIDRLIGKIVSDNEVLVLDAIQGNLDFGGMFLKTADFPLYLENETQGDYRVLRWKSGNTTMNGYAFNLNHKDPVLREIFNDVRFRRAMSLAIDREEMNEFLFAGTGEPAQITVAPNASYYEAQWGETYSEFDQVRAERLLDQMGLTKGSDGYRRRSDGAVLEIIMNVVASPEANELVKDYWEAVGIKVNIETLSAQLYFERVQANDMDIVGGEGQRLAELRAYNIENTVFNFGGDYDAFAIEWHRWFGYQNWVAAGSQGDAPAAGEEPPQYIKDYYDLVTRWQSAGTDSEYESLAKEVWDFHAENLFWIGTVARPLWPVIVKNRVRNVPEEELPFSDDTSWWLVAKPIQWYIAE